MPRTALTAIIALIALWLAAAAQADVVQLGTRWYRIDLPAQAAGAPILLVLHGGGGNPDQFARASGLSGPATAAGYAVIFPAGSGRTRLLTWNGGYCCGQAAREGLDDLGFLDAVAADAAARFGLDPGGVFVTGMSNGSILAEAYAATRPEKVRAVAGVAGTLDLARFPPQGPVPILHIHGTADGHVRYTGSPGPDALVDSDFTPVDAVIAAFRGLAGPGLTRSQRQIDPVTDGTWVTETTWSRGGRPWLRLLTVWNGGHVWPGGARAGRQSGATGDIDVNSEILRFFAEQG